MGKLSRLREIRRAHRGMQSDSVRVKLSSLDDASKFYVGQTVTMPGIKGLRRQYRHTPVTITAVDEANGIITISTTGLA